MINRSHIIIVDCLFLGICKFLVGVYQFFPACIFVINRKINKY